MSREERILNNNLRGINNNLDNLSDGLSNVNSNLGNINYKIGNINEKQAALDGRVSSLSDTVKDFIATDNKNKQLQLAETRQGNLKQELQNKFGYYAELRRMVLGILQAVDSGIVSQETMQTEAETLMIKTPDYWLAPALLAFVSWIGNDKENTEKALKEALRRDDYKTTLFFMLLMRRLGRYDACHQWLQRYLMHQDPSNLDREFITILEAASTGSFHPAARQLIMSSVENWIHELTQKDKYINRQKDNWLKFFQNKGDLGKKDYPLLQQYCTNWADLTASMKKVRAHQVIINYFKNILTSTIDPAKSSVSQLDDILSILVTNFDDEELELQQKVRFNQLIIDKNGDRLSASSSYNSEKKFFTEKTDFLQMLTNSAFNPQMMGVSKATQTLAVAISRPWIIEAHDSFTADYRMNAVTTANLDIEGFQTSSSFGSDETEQLVKHDEYWEKSLKEGLKKSSSGNGCMLILPIPFIVLAIFIYKNGAHILSYVIFSICFAFLSFVYLGNRFSKEDVKKKNNDSCKNSKEILRGCLAELVDFKKEYDVEDAKAELLRTNLQSLSPNNFAGTSRDTRTIL